MTWDQIIMELKTRRIEMNLSQRELASMMHVWQSQLSAWESGRQMPHISALLTWTATLGMSVHMERDR